MQTSKLIEAQERITSKSVLGVVHTPSGISMPRGACDCHVHVFGEAGRYKFAEDRVFMPSPVTVDDLIDLQAALHLDRVVVVQASPQGRDNSCLMDTLQELRRRGREARGVAVVDDMHTEDDLDRLHDAGVRGIRVNLQSHGTSVPEIASHRLRKAAAAAMRRGWHVQVYTSLNVIGAIAGEIDCLGVPVVVDHFGLAHARDGKNQAGFTTLCDLVRGGNVYVKLSAPYRIVQQGNGEDGMPIARALIEANPQRMLWGTDWPHTHHAPGMPRLRDRPEPFQPIDDGQQLQIFKRWTTPEERNRILVKNPQSLYDFADKGSTTP
jgi:predicted TIM-barrel fold metal-dependent hydrolase